MFGYVVRRVVSSDLGIVAEQRISCFRFSARTRMDWVISRKDLSKRESASSATR